VEANSPVTPLISSQTKGKAKMHLFMMKPPMPSKGLSLLAEGEPSEKSHVDETYDEMYSNHQAQKNIRQIQNRRPYSPPLKSLVKDQDVKPPPIFIQSSQGPKTVLI
jgi:hypothetical protein